MLASQPAASNSWATTQTAQVKEKNSHGLHGLLDELHPGVALLLAAGQHLHHLWLGDAGRDEEEATLFVSDLPHNQLLEGDDGGALVLEAEAAQGLTEAGREEQENKEESGRVKGEEEGRQMLNERGVHRRRGGTV